MQNYLTWNVACYSLSMWNQLRNFVWVFTASSKWRYFCIQFHLFAINANKIFPPKTIKIKTLVLNLNNQTVYNPQQKITCTSNKTEISDERPWSQVETPQFLALEQINHIIIVPLKSSLFSSSINTPPNSHSSSASVTSALAPYYFTFPLFLSPVFALFFGNIFHFPALKTFPNGKLWR